MCPSGLVLVTDAIMAMGLPPGRHTLGQQVVQIQGLHAYVAGLRLPRHHRCHWLLSRGKVFESYGFLLL